MSADPNPRAWVHSNNANYHLCNSRDLFKTYDAIEALPLHNHFGPCGTSAVGIGNVELQIQKSNGTKAILKLTEVLHTPGGTVNLVSGPALCNDGATGFDYGAGKATDHEGHEVAWFPVDGLYCLKLADGNDRLFPPSVRKEDRPAMMVTTWVESPPIKKPKMSRYQFVKQGWGSRAKFQYSYGLKLTPEDFAEGNDILDALMEAESQSEAAARTSATTA